jgi:hypothetical protein
MSLVDKLSTERLPVMGLGLGNRLWDEVHGRKMSILLNHCTGSNGTHTQVTPPAASRLTRNPDLRLVTTYGTNDR